MPVSVNHYMKPRGILKYKGKKPYAMAMMYETAEAKQYKEDFIAYVKQEIIDQQWDNLIDKNIFFIIDTYFYFPRTDMDCNNYYKIMFDACTEAGVWRDDNITMERVQRIFYDSENPRIELVIYPANYIGIFDNVELYNQFKITYCESCSKGKKGNCSIHKKAIESRIQEDMILENDKWKCLKFKKSKA